MKDFNLQLSWLDDNPKSWVKNKDFIDDKSVFQSVEVVNDCAERAIKLVEDFNGTRTKTETDLQNLLLTVDYHRKIFPTRGSKSLASKQTMVKGNFLKKFSFGFFQK